MSQPALKVAFDNSLSGRNLTGTGVYASELIREISANPEIRLSVLSGWGSGTGGGAAIRKLRGVGRLAWSHAYLPLALRKTKFDIFHSPAFTIPPGCPCPTVVTIHDLSFLMYPHHFEPAWRRYVTSLMPYVLRSASGIICVSESTRHDLQQHYQVPDKKIHVVYNGLDHSRFQPDAKLDKEWAASLGIRTPYMLHVGALSERKNIPVLLRAVAMLRDQKDFDSGQLVLAGAEAPGLTGAHRIDDTIRQLRLENIVVRVGHVPSEKLAGLYAGATLLVMPSMYEGFGFPVLEAMATGTPVVASNVSSLPEIARDAAALVPPGDEQALAEGIHSLLNSNSRREQLRLRGLEQSKKFSWQRTAQETAAVYHAAASSLRS